MITAAAEGAGPLIHVVASQARARALHRLVRAFHPDLRVGFLPEWDVRPYGGQAPSPAVMGQRMGLLRWLIDRDRPPQLVLTTAPALLRRVPPLSVWEGARFEFRTGERIEPEAMAVELQRIGYFQDGRVDVPGEFAIRGRVVDLFPAAAAMPCRIAHENGRIVSIRSYDPRTQRSLVDTDSLLVDPASETMPATGEPGEAAMVAAYERLADLFEYAPGARLSIAPDAVEEGPRFLEQVAAAYAAAGSDACPPERLFLSSNDWNGAVADRSIAMPRLPDWQPVPRFAEQAGAARRLSTFLSQLPDTCRVVVATPADALSPPLSRALEEATPTKPLPAAWPAVADAAPGSVLAVPLPVDRGFLLPEAGIAVLAAADILGSRAMLRPVGGRADLPGGVEGFAVGDLLLHLDHGLGRLDGIDRAEWSPGRHREAIRLRYAGRATMIVPVSELGAVWRYGGDGEAVGLHRLGGEEWARQKAELEADVARTARRLVALVAERRRRRAPRLVADDGAYERFAGRFPFPLSPDQMEAIEAVRDDLAAGRPMDRIVCGDVGFGKTEVALRAAAIAVLAGHQVAVVAPTSILARQHWRTFEKRFRPMGVAAAYLSGDASADEGAAIRARLLDGTLPLVIGTHALAAGDIRLKPGSLVVIDEEHRFGADDKLRLRRLAKGCHTLTLTATPIPRTLQATLVGLQELSVVSTPPVARRPVRTVVAPFADALVVDALRQEHRRGGQSYLVCPRIADIPAIEARIGALLPELELQVLHGRLPRAEMDARMAAFAEGDGDLLIATNIIESGLDVPNANTILVWRADRFGLAQLHQLRGRVGRGEREGVACLLTDPARPPGEATARRLAAMQAADHLGAGFEVSRLDLDQRGAGDLLGEDQSGHMALVGAEFYRYLLDRALRTARGEAVEAPWTPELLVDLGDGIPEDYVPEPDIRIALYAAAAKLDGEDAIDRFAGELVDRFGPLPPPVAGLITFCRLRTLCQQAGIARLVAGPKAVVLHLRPDGRAEGAAKLPRGWLRQDDRLVLRWPRELAAEAIGPAAADAAARLLRGLRASARRRPRPATPPPEAAAA
ncbi:transcription-repair-coupling factor [Allostella humosa]|uniref:DEAD/DEAH box helicase n=1 Tax=Stella humosa TaxID=94 RepID=UPI000F4C2D3C|nr:DEAD/DEAH box helicase [Stella humosa]BBK32675.1 transcription-repair-coupling factor [Stella humosa]